MGDKKSFVVYQAAGGRHFVMSEAVEGSPN
jgi:hypothetical protein